MKIKNLILILLIVSLSVVPTLAHRLMHETYDSSENSATALYLDESTGNLVVQKYHLSDSGLKSSEFKFPQRVQSFGSFYHPISKLRPEIKEEKKVIEMGKSSPKVQ
uniref:hypothetical protein n=1 Tax=Halobacteriovorax sp. TaxID=2020862 RepID=UPI0035638F5D